MLGRNGMGASGTPPKALNFSTKLVGRKKGGEGILPGGAGGREGTQTMHHRPS